MTSNSDESDLIEYAQSGSREALGRLSRRHVNFVYGIARREISDAHRAEDVTQAVFLILSRRAGRIKPAFLTGWLFSTTRHVAANALRSAARRRHHERHAAAQIPEHVMAVDPADIEHLQHHLHAALSSIREADRSIVLMRYMQSQDVPQIAAAMRLSDAAVRKRLERTMEKLRRFLTGRGVVLEAAVIAGAVGAISRPAPAALSAAVAGIAAPTALTLAKSALAAMVWMQLKVAMIVFLTLGLSTAAVVILAHHTALAQIAAPTSAPSPTSAPAPEPAKSVVYSGTVFDPQDKPLAGVRVWSELNAWNPDRSNSLETQTTTDAEGHYVFPPLPLLIPITREGIDYSERNLHFDHPDYAIAWNHRRAEDDDKAQDQIELSTHMETPTSLSVQVRDPDGKPIAGAAVSLWLQHMSWSRTSEAYGYLTIPVTGSQMKTDDRGTVQFDRLPPTARAHVSVSHPDFVRFHSRDHYEGDDFPVRAGFGPFVATLHPGGKIRVRVPMIDGQPSPRVAKFYVTSDSSPRSGFAESGTADANGTYLLTGLEAGTYKVSLWPISRVPSDQIISPAIGVTVVVGQTADALLRPVSGHVVRGRIIDQLTKLPQTQVYVSISSADSDLQPWSTSAQTDEKGQFILAAPAGKNVLSYASFPNGEYTTVKKSLTVDSNGPTDAGDVEMVSPPAMRGRLVDSAGKPIAGKVIMWDDQATAAADGSFSLPIRNPDQKDDAVFAFNSALTLGASLWVEDKFLDPKLALPGADRPILVLKPTAVITGEVLNASAQPVNNAHIGLYFEAPDHTSSGADRPPWGGFSREGNHFTFTSVPVGVVAYVDIDVEGAQAQPHLDNLSPGEIRDLGPVLLKPVRPRTARGAIAPDAPDHPRDFSGKVMGRVFDVENKPVVGARVDAWPENDLHSQRQDVTDHEGRFIIEHMVRGEKVTVSFEKSGYQNKDVTVAEGDQNIEIHVQSTATDLIGKPAPDLAISRWVVGGPLSFHSELRGRVVLLHIGVDVSEGEYGREYDRLAEWYQKYQSRGLTIIAIHCDPENARPQPTTADQIVDYAKRKQFAFPFAIDSRQSTRTHGWSGGETAARYGIEEPGYIMIDRKGLVRAAPTQSNLQEWIEKLLAE